LANCAKYYIVVYIFLIKEESCIRFIKRDSKLTLASDKKYINIF